MANYLKNTHSQNANQTGDIQPFALIDPSHREQKSEITLKSAAKAKSRLAWCESSFGGSVIVIHKKRGKSRLFKSALRAFVLFR